MAERPIPTREEFFRAVRDGDVRRVKPLLDADRSLVNAHDPSSFGSTALIHAAGAGDQAMIDLLLDCGADPNGVSDWWAGGFGPLDSSDDATTDHLLSRGARLTPHAAARLGRLTDLRSLLDESPELVHQRGGDGQFPLHFARSVAIAALLLDRGAEIDARDLDHASTAAQWAAHERRDVCAFLVARGAKPDLFMACMIDDVGLVERMLAADPEGLAARITPERFPAPGSQALGIYHYTVGTGCGPLHAACSAGAARACGWLLSRGADPTARGGYDDATPLHQAAWNNHAEVAKLLIDSGAPIDARSGRLHNNTPLGWAIVAGSFEVAQTLLDRGAAVLDFHPSDAASGAAGAFRCFKRHVRPEQWEKIAGLLAGGVFPPP